MTVITITTVGFGEVVPLDNESKIFTVFLILISIVIVGYALSVITEYILSKNNVDELNQKKMQKLIDSLKNHIIICGYGRNGKQAARKLSAYKKSFVVIEKDKELTQISKDLRNKESPLDNSRGLLFFIQLLEHFVLNLIIFVRFIFLDNLDGHSFLCSFLINPYVHISCQEHHAILSLA